MALNDSPEYGLRITAIQNNVPKQSIISPYILFSLGEHIFYGYISRFYIVMFALENRVNAGFQLCSVTEIQL